MTKIFLKKRNYQALVKLENKDKLSIELKDLEFSLLRTYSETNLLNDPLRILRCFRFVSELNFKIDLNLISFIKKNKGKLYLVAK